MSRLLAIDADLSTPPSSPLVYRDITLYAAIRAYETVAIAPADLRAAYARWFQRYGIWDYLADILTPAEVARERVTVAIESGPNARLNASNLHAILAHIPA